MLPAKLTVVIISFLMTVLAINRSVYKIVLNQKGFAQFIQYDLEIPPIREFTFCTWIRVYDLENDQSIFTYIVNGNNRVVRLWLDSGGRYMTVSFNKEILVHVPVEIERDVWRHVCLSYQADFGAWALYIDSRLISCEVSQKLHGFVMPAGGSVIIGYGTSDIGAQMGLEGEIFGVNMILTSTIERNYTMRNHPQFVQKSFRKNKIRGIQNVDYIVLNDLQAEIDNVTGKLDPPFLRNKLKSFIKVQTPTSYLEHDVGLRLRNTKSKLADNSNEKEILDIVVQDKERKLDDKATVNFWNLVNEAGHSGKFKAPSTKRPEPSNSETQERRMISEYETPPSISATRNDYLEKKLEFEKPPVSESIYKINEEVTPPTSKGKVPNMYAEELPDVEVPPPPVNDKKVYGQWTSSKYAGSVLNYLKSINFYNKEKKAPTTIPLTKISDNFPYPSDLKINVVRPPTNLQRKKLLSKRRFHSQYNVHPNSLKRLHVEKRNVKPQEINVKILKDDLRNEILKTHAKTQPRDVEITVRGETKKKNDNRLYRDVESLSEESAESSKYNRFDTSDYNLNSDQVSQFNHHKSNSLLNVLPFLKSIEYFTGEKEEFESNKVNLNDMYVKSFANANKWHNIKSYNNDYTPRRTPILEDGKTELDQKIAEANKRYPSIRLKYKPEYNKIVTDNKDDEIIKGRELALDISNQSNSNSDTISILKYNHGYLPGHNTQLKSKDDLQITSKTNKINDKSNFDKRIKIGNALNERHIIGFSQEQNKKSFVGGNERIPDIQRYRSDIDNEKDNVPSSLKPRACKNVELYNNILFVQPDGSIDMTHILSPLKVKNVGIEFVIQNYQKCSLEESALEKNYLLLINWNQTPVRLFGGATAKKTKDLCGFF